MAFRFKNGLTAAALPGLLDLSIPEIDGWNLAEMFKSNDRDQVTFR
jgi:hypothetical protein